MRRARWRVAVATKVARISCSSCSGVPAPYRRAKHGYQGPESNQRAADSQSGGIPATRRVSGAASLQADAVQVLIGGCPVTMLTVLLTPRHKWCCRTCLAQPGGLTIGPKEIACSRESPLAITAQGSCSEWPGKQDR